MDFEQVPSSQVASLLAEYAELLAEHGPDSKQARQFLEANKFLPLFEENAVQLYRLEKEDYEDRKLLRTQNPQP